MDGKAGHWRIEKAVKQLAALRNSTAPTSLIKESTASGPHLYMSPRDIWVVRCRFNSSIFSNILHEVAFGNCKGWEVARGVCEAITDTMSCALRHLFTKVITSLCLFSEPRRHFLELYFYIILTLITPHKCLLSFFSSFQTHYITNTLQWDKIIIWPKPDNSYASYYALLEQPSALIHSDVLWLCFQTRGCTTFLSDLHLEIISRNKGNRTQCLSLWNVH